MNTATHPSDIKVCTSLKIDISMHKYTTITNSTSQIHYDFHVFWPLSPCPPFFCLPIYASHTLKPYWQYRQGVCAWVQAEKNKILISRWNFQVYKVPHSHTCIMCMFPTRPLLLPSPTHTYRGSHRHTQRIIHRRLAMWESDVFRRKSKNNKDCLKRSMFPWKLPVLPQLLMQWAARGRLGIGRGSENFAPAGTVEEKRGNWCTCKKSGEKELPQNLVIRK